jgi:hypothetical protein
MMFKGLFWDVCWQPNGAVKVEIRDYDGFNPVYFSGACQNTLIILPER